MADRAELIEQIDALLAFQNPVPPIPNLARELLAQASAALSSPAGAGPDDAAQIVYEAMSWAASLPGKAGDPLPPWAPSGNSFAQDRARKVASVLRAQPAGVKVRGLEWENNVASTLVGSYSYYGDDEDGWKWTFHEYPYGDENGAATEAEAKAAAQADYERRILSALEPAALSKQEAVPQLGGAPDDLRNCCAVLFEYLDIGQINEFTKKVLARRDPALTSPAPAEPSDRPSGHVEIAHDGFAGDIIGHYTTREGKRGVVVQQDGTRVVHVYGEKWLAPAPHGEGA